MQFKDLELSDEILSAVELLGFTEMTEIQEKSIPIILEGKDVIGLQIPELVKLPHSVFLL